MNKFQIGDRVLSNFGAYIVTQVDQYGTFTLKSEEGGKITRTRMSRDDWKALGWRIVPAKPKPTKKLEWV